MSGASGFIGSNISDKLKLAGISVEMLPHSELLSMEFDLDIRRKWELVGKTQGVSTFLHLAWNVNSSAWRDTPSQKMLIKNTEIFLQTVKNIDFVLSTGSCQEYLPKRIKITENSELAFDCNYVIDKHAMHTLFKEYSEIMGYGFSWIRLFNVYGVGDHPNRVVSLLLDAAKKGIDFRLVDPDHSLDLLHIEDAVKGLMRVFLKRSGGVYNLGSGSSVTPNAIKKFLNQQKLTDPVLYSTDIRTEFDDLAHIADISSISRLGWEPEHTLPLDLRAMMVQS